MFSISWSGITTMQAADDREAEVRRSLRDTELKHKQQIQHLDASVQELQRYNYMAIHIRNSGLC